MSSVDGEARDFVRETRDLLSDVLRYSQNPYAQAYAFVSLKHGGTQRDIQAIEADLEALRTDLEE